MKFFIMFALLSFQSMAMECSFKDKNLNVTEEDQTFIYGDYVYKVYVEDLNKPSQFDSVTIYKIGTADHKVTFTIDCK